MKHQESKFLAPNGARLYSQSWEPDTPAVAVLLLAHGLAEHSGRYNELAEYFVAAGYAVFALDHEGHGNSEGRPGHIDRFEDFTRALETFADSVQERYAHTPMILVGHSMGGLIGGTLLLNAQRKFACCVLSGAAVKAAEEPPAWLLFIGRILSVLTPRLGQLQLDASAVSRDPDVVSRYVNDPLVYTGKVSVRCATELFAAMARLRAAAPSITLPILFVHGGEDSLAAVEGSRILHAQVSSQDKTLIVYDDLYHEIFNEPERARVFADVRDWLDARVRQPVDQANES